MKLSGYGMIFGTDRGGDYKARPSTGGGIVILSGSARDPLYYIGAHIRYGRTRQGLNPKVLFTREYEPDRDSSMHVVASGEVAARQEPKTPNFDAAVLYNDSGQPNPKHVPLIIVARDINELFFARRRILDAGIKLHPTEDVSIQREPNGLIGISYETTGLDQIAQMGNVDGVKLVRSPNLKVGYFRIDTFELSRVVNSLDPATLEERVKTP